MIVQGSQWDIRPWLSEFVKVLWGILVLAIIAFAGETYRRFRPVSQRPPDLGQKIRNWIVLILVEQIRVRNEKAVTSR